MKTYLVAAILLLLLGSCDSIVPSSIDDLELAIAESGIQGEVLMGPMNPVQSTANPGSDYVPVEWDLVISAPGLDDIEVRSAADGQFSVQLSPGTYLIKDNQPSGGAGGLPAIGSDSGPYPKAVPVSVDVPLGEFVQVRVDVDTGIR